MEDYIEEALATGYIRPSTPPAATGFFFVEKKDGGLRPCIDYRGLNALTVCYPYPLPSSTRGHGTTERGSNLFQAGFTQCLQPGANQKRKSEWKTAFYTTRVHYVPYGLANAPAVFQGKPKRLHWMDQARAAFGHLKKSFIKAPILRHPDPSLPFIIEEWRHWLEGAQHPFLVLTDHSNLEYHRNGKRLNPRQARVHEAPSSGHLGIHRTITLIQSKFWWPSLSHDVEEHIEVCATCAQSRTSLQLPTGLLEPLPVPQRPWSHMVVDFITDLPDSEGYKNLGGSRPVLKSLPTGPTKGPTHSHGNIVQSAYTKVDYRNRKDRLQASECLYGGFLKCDHVRLVPWVVCSIFSPSMVARLPLRTLDMEFLAWLSSL
ncbi:hypothetical protein QTP70_007863 [Hemibagrus guttatus]|uniref:Gypsy retrotransposon integrase-like protein 1 n=1 Tax=Hemibagrus guttatus TaxID=175788 RepID=A0AAE0V244_9TELE|nr:hypothetical protein QTP70_007863 [Hemibagrus guttatus]